VGDRSQSGAAIHRGAIVIAVSQVRLARVQRQPNAQRLGRRPRLVEQGALSSACAGCSIGGAGEDRETAISLERTTTTPCWATWSQHWKRWRLFQGICDPGAWLRNVVAQIVASFLGGLISGIGGAIASFPNNVDFLLRTPEKLSYQNDTVQQFADASRALANGLLAVVALVGGYNVMFRPYLGWSYASALELLPRFLLGAILVNTVGWWVRLAIDVNNAVCCVFGAGPPPNLADTLARSMLPTGS
jgi:hypothetical protein